MVEGVTVLIFILYALCGVMAVYLAAGLLLLWPIHRRGLPQLDPACAQTGILFRILISPGLIALWPVLLVRWRTAKTGGDTAGSPTFPLGPIGQRRWHIIASFSLALLGPLIMYVGLEQREIPKSASENAIHVTAVPPIVTTAENSEPESTESLGVAFPTLPAQVNLATYTPEDIGLQFRFDDVDTRPPAALYWAEGLSQRDGIPQNAVMLGVVAGPNPAWFRFPDAKMAHSGYWILYTFQSGTSDIYDVTAREGKYVL